MSRGQTGVGEWQWDTAAPKGGRSGPRMVAQAAVGSGCGACPPVAFWEVLA
jgi:hypothetical protein